MTITYRDVKGVNLTAAEVDENFRDLDGRVTDLEDNPPEPISIDDITQTGGTITVELTNGALKGPFVLPTTRWSWKGEWAPLTPYSELDVFSIAGDIYVVTYAHTSAATFDPGANGGSGLDYYGLMMSSPESIVPTGGTEGQVLTKVSSTDYDIEWADSTAAERVETISCSLLVDDVFANRSQYFCAPFDGDVVGVDATFQTSLAVAGTITVSVEGVSTGAVATVPGSPAPSAGDSFSYTSILPVHFDKGDSISLGVSFTGTTSLAPFLGAIEVTIRLRQD